MLINNTAHNNVEKLERLQGFITLLSSHGMYWHIAQPYLVVESFFRLPNIFSCL